MDGTRSFSGWVGSTDTNDHYRFYVGSTSNLSLILNGLSADADVQLLNSSGSIISSSSNGSSTAESITQSLSPGTYYVQVYPYGSANTNYNLSLSVPTTTFNMGVNQTLSGSLSTTDPSNSTRTGSYKDDYRLTGVTVGQPVKVNLNSSAFDAYVQIINESTGAVVTYNDDANGTNNSELTFTPQSGVTYLVRVTSFSSGITGAYSLSTTSTPPTNVTITASDSSAAETISGQTANPGQFTITRTGSTANALTVNYTVAGTATKGTDYSNLTGSLTIPAGSTTATLPVNVIDDSTVEGSETSVVSLSSSSAYTLGSTSSATVTITDNDAAAINMGVNQTLSGSLSTTDPSNSTRTGSYKDDYRLTGVTVGQPVKVNLNSSAFDAYVQIINESTGAVVTYNDDANGTNNSELTFTPQSGVTYLVRVTSFSSGITGAYSLSTSSGSSDWFAQNIQDPGLQSIARSRASDNVLDRNDMIAILRDAKDGSVIDANELTSLRTLVNNASRFNMPDSVRVLSNKIVNSDPANQRYQGSSLGNLFAGSSGTQMDNLINKWFLGLDRPSTPYTYQYATGSLFVNGATYQDIDQGAANDCYYLASLAATAFRSPSTIQNMFIDNGDNTYTVRFYNGGVTDYVTVDRYLPTSSGSPTYAQTPNGELWVALAEKAYAQVNQSGWIQQDGTNSYSGIDYGSGYYAIPHITGRITSSVYDPSGIVNTNAIINAFNAGSMITVASKDSGVASNVVPNHEYTLVGYNSSTQQFTLYNPWGVNGGHLYGTFKPGQLQLTASQLSQSFTAWAYTTNSGLAEYGSSTTLQPELSGQKI
nr:C2 family cysteine protease [Limnoraphis robusta]